MRDINRLYTVDALRGVAALGVAIFHLTNGNPDLLPDGSWLKWLGSFGYLGVPMFFVISGYIIPYSMGLRDYRFQSGYRGFLARRLIRIEPAYLGSIVLTIALAWASSLVPGSQAKTPEVSAVAVLSHVAYLTPWTGQQWIEPVYWSLAIEFQYYILMLVSAPLLISKIKNKTRCFLAIAALLCLVDFDTRLFPAFLPLFGLGFVVFVSQLRRLSPAECFCWGTLFFVLGLWSDENKLNILAAAIAALAIFIPRANPIRVLGWLGTVSFSLYLVHVPIGGKIINLAVRSESELVRFLAVPVALAISLLAAWAFWRIFESIIPDYLTDRLNRSKRPVGLGSRHGLSSDE